MRILIGVMSCQSYTERRQRCLESWIPEAIGLGMDVVFLIGGSSGNATRDGLTLNLPCPDDYASLPQKTCHFLQWAIEHSDCDYVFKCDDDTYLRPDRLAAVETNGRDYIGAEWSPGVGYGSGGAGYWLSRRGMTIVTATLIRHLDGAEDLLVGQCLANAHVPLHIDARFIAFGNADLRPKLDNDVIATHGCDAPWKAHMAEFCGHRPVVSCVPAGRLGNNMFQVAAALGYAAKYPTHDPIFQVGTFGRYGNTMFSRLKYSELPKEHMTIHDAPDFAFNKQIPAYPYCSVVFNGFMQSEKYFAHCSDLIRQTFAIRPAVKAELYARFRKELQAGAVSLHVRRGDYLSKPEFHPVQPIEYYLHAIQYLTDRVSVPYILCLSDDPDWCRQKLLPADQRLIVVEGQDDYSDLALMTLCRHHIIANSSFSWWGAWLGTNSQKIVVAPDVFWGSGFSGYSEHDLIPCGWIRIPTDRLSSHQAGTGDHRAIQSVTDCEESTANAVEIQHQPPRFSHGITMDQIRRLVGRDDPVVLELGCNDGSDTIRFLEEFPQITIHCFEPDSRPLERFCIRDYRCALHRVAIAKTDGIVLLHRSGGSPPDQRMADWDLSSSIYAPTGHLNAHPWCTFERKVVVPTRSLDSWYSEHLSSTQVDFLWADIQGAEGDLIRGGRSTLCDHTKYVYTECYESPMYESQPTRIEILEMLPEFECIGIFEGYNILLRNRRLCSADRVTLADQR